MYCNRGECVIRSPIVSVQMYQIINNSLCYDNHGNYIIIVHDPIWKPKSARVPLIKHIVCNTSVAEWFIVNCSLD